MTFISIARRLVENAESNPQGIAFRFLGDTGQEVETLNHAALYREVMGVASYLSQLAEPGSTIMLLFSPGLSYIKAFYGCLMAGMIAVPLYPPKASSKSDRIVKVAQNANSTIALTSPQDFAVVSALWGAQNGQEISIHVIDQQVISTASDDMQVELDMHAPAFLQYTSGSTGSPKGVMISHENIVANAKHLSLMSTGNRDDVFVNWLPLFHDLGLVTAILWPTYLGATSILMAPASFVRRPRLWLEAITRYHGTMCGAPNFAYALCAEKVSEDELGSLDLTSWRVAYNAAEPINPNTLDAFANKFAVCGFRPEALYPAYGMAEATVMISGGNAANPPVLLTVNKKILEQNRLEVVSPAHPSAARLVGCGTADAPHDIRIVDPETCVELADGGVGEVWFSGPSVAQGYWRAQEATSATFGQTIINANDANGAKGVYLRTGDLGLRFQGELFITGRIKDIIILRGRNLYPQDIESSVAAANRAIRAGHVAAFAVNEDGDEKLVVVAELEREYFRSINVADVARAVSSRIYCDHEVELGHLVLLRPFRIPMTSSGKIQRAQTKALYLQKNLDVIGELHQLSPTLYVAPTTDTEIKLCAIWREILGRDRIGTDENFFEIGGNSLRAIEIMSRIENLWPGVSLEFEYFNEHATINSMANAIDARLMKRLMPQEQEFAGKRTVVRV